MKYFRKWKTKQRNGPARQKTLGIGGRKSWGWSSIGRLLRGFENVRFRCLWRIGAGRGSGGGVGSKLPLILIIYLIMFIKFVFNLIKFLVQKHPTTSSVHPTIEHHINFLRLDPPIPHLRHQLIIITIPIRYRHIMSIISTMTQMAQYSTKGVFYRTNLKTLLKMPFCMDFHCLGCTFETH